MNNIPSTSTSQKKPHKKRILFWGALLTLIMSVATSFSVLQMNFLGADLFATNTLPGVNTDDIYIPNYSSGIGGNTGQLEVRARNDIGTFDAMSFKINYSPVNALSFSDSPIVVEPGDAFSDTSILLQLADTSVPGELSLVVALDDPITVPEVGSIDPDDHFTHPILFRLQVDVSASLTNGQVVDMTASELSVLDGVTPLAGINTMTAGDITIDTQPDLRITTTEIIDSTHVDIHFSDYISDIATTVDYVVQEFGDPGMPVAVSDVTLLPNQQSVRLTLGAATDPATEYTVYITENVIGNSEGPSRAPYNIGVFYGFNPAAGQSTARISEIEPLSNNSLRVTFSEAIDPSTLTPVNLDIFRFGDPENLPLTDRVPLITTSILEVSSTVFDVTTSAQIAEMAYHAVLFNVEDDEGQTLNNHNSSIFYGYTPSTIFVNSVDPNSVLFSESTQSITLSGNNLNLVTDLRIDGQSMNITNQSVSSLTFTLPASFPAGGYSIVMEDQNGSLSSLNGAFIVEETQTDLQVVSASSQAIPFSAAPGQTTTLWVLIDDDNTGDIDSVSVDLSPIAGPTSFVLQKDEGPQATGTQWYRGQLQIPEFAVTSATPYQLPVSVKQNTNTFSGTMSIMISNNVYQSEAPVFVQAHVSPAQVPPDALTPIKLSAQVQDTDGVAGMTVTADLGAIGAGFIQLVPINEIPENQEVPTMFFESEEEFTIPTSVAEGGYNISFIATDSTGEVTTLNRTLVVSKALTGVRIDEELSYLSRSSVPRGSDIPFSVYAFATHPNGVDNIVSVTADFGTLGIAPTPLQKDPSATGGNGAWFLSEELTVPETAYLGTHDITLVATGQNGSTASATLELQVSSEDLLGEIAILDVDSFYTTPSVLPNDGKTSGTLYAFVEKADEDTSVIVNLAPINGYLSEAGMAKSSAQEGCDTSNTIVCMTPGVQEGSSGRWFLMDGVIVPSITQPSSEPYSLKVTVVKNDTGQAVSSVVPVYVNDGNKNTNDDQPPRLNVGITTDSKTVLAVFSEEMNPDTISKNDFTITASNDTNDELDITDYSINSAGNIVTLKTQTQITGKLYTMTVENVEDAVGVKIVPGAGNRVPVIGFGYSGVKPEIAFVDSTSPTTVDLEFNTPIDPRSISLGSALNDSQSYTFDIKIKEEDNGSKLSVLGLTMKDPKTFEVRTGAQIADERYILSVDQGLKAYDGTVAGALSALFKGFKGIPGLGIVGDSNCAFYVDIICDGVVNFEDFTIFSFYYNTTYSSNGNGNISDEQLEENTNAIEQSGGTVPTDGTAFESGSSGPTVPTNSIPAGGEIN